MTPTEEDQLRQRLDKMQKEHRVLDRAIAEMARRPVVDEMEMRRLKKRKLELKDRIEILSSRLIPNLLA